MRRQTLGWSLCNVGVKPSIHPPVSPITSQHEERWGEVGSPPMWTPSLLVATLSKDSFLLWLGTPGYKPSQRSPWWHYLELTVFSAWALAQILFKKKSCSMLFTVFAWLEHLYRRPAYEVEPTGTQGPASHAFCVVGWFILQWQRSQIVFGPLIMSEE